MDYLTIWNYHLGNGIQEWIKWNLWQAAFKLFEVICSALTHLDVS